jgi:hypothetical protein
MLLGLHQQKKEFAGFELSTAVQFLQVQHLRPLSYVS